MLGGRDPMVGRDAQLASALAGVERLAAGAGRAVLIEGEAGIGKSRLLDEVVHHAGERGFRVVRGAGRQLEAELPLAAFADALRGRADSSATPAAMIARLLAAAPGAPARADAALGQRRLEAIHAIADLIEDLCGEGPLVLAMEDAHWVDGASLAVVDRLAGRLAHLPLLLMLTARPYPRSMELHGLVDRLVVAGATHVTLGGLDASAVADLARAVLRAEPGPRLLGELSAAAGNPLFAGELLGAYQEEQRIEVRDGRAELIDARVPPSLRSTVLRRLSVLPAPTVEVLTSAAVLGSAFDAAALAAFVDRPHVEVAADLEPARQCNVIAELDGRLAFRHDLIRDAVYENLPASVRGALHAAAADALTAAGYRADATAPHLLRATLVPDPLTIERLRAAADQLMPRAPDVAAALLRRAAELAPESHPTRVELRLELATAFAWAQRVGEAAAIADELLDDVECGPLRRAALILRATLGQFLGGLERFGDALEAAAAEEDADQSERARLLALATASWAFSDDPQRALTVGHHALSAAEEAGDEVAVCAALQTLAIAAEASSDFTSAIGFVRRAVDLWRGSRDSELRRLLEPELELATIIGNSPEHRDEALELSRAGVVRSEERGLLEFAVRFQLTFGTNLWRAGRWEEAAVELEAAVERALEIGRAASTVVDGCCRLARLAVHRDDLAAAQAWLARADAAVDDAPVSAIAVHLAVTRAEVMEAGAQPEAAVALLAEAYTAVPPPVRPVLVPVIGLPLVRLAAAVDGWAAEARDVAAAAVDVGTDAISPWLRGLVAGDVELLADALRRARRHGTSVRADLPKLCEDAAALLSAAGRSNDAVALLAEAVEVWEDMGAVRDVARVEARLRELGVRRGRRGPRARPSIGWDALTETEQRVVELVAEGLIYRDVADRMFISRRTVETHVAHVFAKLGVASRRELELAYAERQGSLASVH